MLAGKSILMSAVMTFVVMAGALYAEVSEYTVDESTLGLWHFNEGEGEIIKDATANGNDGKRRPEKTGWIEGKFGKALKFNKGSALVEVVNAELFNFGPEQSFMLECWIKTDTGGQYIRKFGGSGKGGYWIGVHRTGRVRALISNGQKAVNVFSNTKVNDNEWHHIAMLRDATKGNVHIYVDGKIEETGEVPPGEISCNTPLYFGYYNPAGIIDEARIYSNRADPSLSALLNSLSDW